MNALPDSEKVGACGVLLQKMELDVLRWLVHAEAEAEAVRNSRDAAAQASVGDKS